MSEDDKRWLFERRPDLDAPGTDHQRGPRVAQVADDEHIELTADDHAHLSTRPRTRGDCVDGPRPCPWAGCRHHLYLDVNPVTGTVKIAFPDREPDELEDSCSLDVAERGGITLEVTGKLLNVTRERTRQLEQMGLVALKHAARRLK